MNRLLTLLLCSYFLTPIRSYAQAGSDLKVIAYYTGDQQKIDVYQVNQLTHIIFSFGHLKNGRFNIDNNSDSTTIQKLVSLKQKNSSLKIMLSLGGWGGCAPCSEAFSTDEGRALFARSVAEVSEFFGTDGIDLDWEYPAIEGYPEHSYQQQDKQNFTSLVRQLRKTLGTTKLITFAAGGFQKYLDESIEWEQVMPVVDWVNIMSYDLVNGYATVTGHHTPLFSTNTTEESADRAVRFLLGHKVPSKKMVIGAAFYTRVWEQVSEAHDGLYQTGKHSRGLDFKMYDASLSASAGWKYCWDKKAQATYWYHARRKSFATGDNVLSVKAKTAYALDKKLGGIMFWELTLDKPKNGLVEAIYQVKTQGK